MGDTSRDGSVARADMCGMGRVTRLGGSIAVQHLRSNVRGSRMRGAVMRVRDLGFQGWW